MYVLGINAAFHDSAACLVKDGQVIAAAEEERFTSVKHGKRPIPFSTYELPFHAIDFCLKEAGVGLHEIDHAAYSYNPYLLLNDEHKSRETIEIPFHVNGKPVLTQWESPWDPLFLSSIVNAPRQLADGYPHHLEKRFRRAKPEKIEWHFVDHHIAHAASAFYAAPFESAAIMTLDGRGEVATTSYGVGEGNKMHRIGEVKYPHSLGLLYEKMTAYLGFLHSSDEYKVMALASYGKPVYADEFRRMIKLGGEGNYTVEDADFEKRFGPRRLRGSEIEQRHYDIAHSLQLVLEETVIELARWLHGKTKMENLCMAGGVALNCVMNARLRDRGPFKNIWVQPAAGDAGTALGAAMWIDAQKSTEKQRRYVMDHTYLGPSFEDKEIEDYLKWSKVPYRKLKNVAEETAEILAQDKVIGWFQGRMEFGPRALGSRSIIASPLHAEMQARLNEIKDREDFRPVAPAVLEEEAPAWFVNSRQSPFMLFVFDVAKDKEKQIPAVTHVDGTARVQTVNRGQNPLYYDLLKTFQAKTGVPVLINTSFNTRGKPIVCTPRDAFECFWTSPLDALVIGSYLIEKKEAGRG